MSEGIDLGSCCMCGGASPNVIVLLAKRGPIPGHGWGCVQCGLPVDGATAVLCDPCFETYLTEPEKLVTACRGYPGSDGRIPIAELPEGVFDHDPSKHPEDAR